MFYEVFGNESKKISQNLKKLIFLKKACFFYTFLRNSKENVRNEKNFFPFSLFLQQINPYNYEPHYQVVFNGEIMQALPVILGFFH